MASCGSQTTTPVDGILLISIDTLRPDHLGAYGYDRPTSPVFDRLAREGVLFEQAQSASSWTLPAHASMLSGLYPPDHGVLGFRNRLAEGEEVLPDRLREAGFTTAAFVNALLVGKQFGFDQGFDTFERLPWPGRAPSGVADRAIEWLDARPDDRPFFLFLHFYDVHSDYWSLPRYEEQFVSPYDGLVDGTTRQLEYFLKNSIRLKDKAIDHLEDLYDAGIRQTDHEVGRIIARLEESEQLDDVLVVVTSDHGEEFGEHGGVLHGRTHYNEILHIPLILRAPGVPPGRRVATPVSIVDIAPTLMNLAGVGGGDLDGRDLALLWQGDGSQDLRPIFAEGDNLHGGARGLRSVRRGRYTLIQGTERSDFELFNLRKDPGEQQDLSDQQPRIKESLADALADFASDRRESDLAEPFSPAEIQKLKSLGYVP